MFARPSPGLAVLTCWVFSSRCVRVCRAGGDPLPERPVAGWGGGRQCRPRGAARRGAAGAAPRRRGARRGSPGGAGETPARGCGKTILMARQRPDRPAGALRERGNEIRFRKGRRKVSRERNYHHNGGKNVSRGKGGGRGVLFCWHFLSVFVIWFGGKRVLDMRLIILISPTQPISKVSVLITPPVLPFIL